MKVLITGAFGYFGLALTERLLEAGHDVYACGRPPRHCPTGMAASGAWMRDDRPQCMHLMFGDVRRLTPEHLRGIDAAVHLAGGMGPGNAAHADRAQAFDDVLAARHVANLAAGLRRIFASSIYVYKPAERPLRESDETDPPTAYGQGKLLAETIWAGEDAICLRFAALYGAGSGVHLGRDGVTERIAHAAVSGSPFTVHGRGDQRVDLVHIDDACSAVARALEIGYRPPPVVNIGGGAPVSVADLVAAAGLARVTRAPDVPVSPTANQSLDVTLAGRLLGWAPRVSLGDGMRGLIEMMRGRAAA